MGNIWSWETDIKAAEIEAAKDAKIAEMEARIAEINREIAEFDTGVALGYRKIFQYNNLECFELATTEIDREVYAKRAGFKNGSHLRASLPINKFKYKAIGYVGLFALPASAMVYLVGKKLINTFERKRVGEPGSAC